MKNDSIKSTKTSVRTALRLAQWPVVDEERGERRIVSQSEGADSGSVSDSQYGGVKSECQLGILLDASKCERHVGTDDTRTVGGLRVVAVRSGH